MPYFVFSIRPFAQIRKLAEFPAFKDASAHAKAMRAARADDNATIKVMFAENEQLAEDLLCQVRDPNPAGDD
ncbi:MAG TPA: hypothetical protein VLJ62_15980 [Burkholderiaceae bacterium]|nr:hypothetical protein [Burkholderiaceae bacterium]